MMNATPPVLVDSTLREGAQAPGVHFSLPEQVAIARALEAVGIREIEIGYAPDGHLDVVLASIRRACPSLRITLWCRARIEDALACVALGPDAIAVAVPSSKLHLEQRLGRSYAWALAQVNTLRAATLGVTLNLGFEDATRADRGFVAALCREADAAGVERVRLADTVGIASPSDIADLVRLARAHFRGAIGLHAHNDFGMATANAISALGAGATRVDVSVLGLGERSGIARLEEVAAYLSLRSDQVRFALADLPSLARLVGTMAGRSVDPRNPIVGSGIFECESGIHVDGLLKDPSTYEPFAPQAVGAVRRTWLGPKSGRGAVAGALQALGIPMTGLELDALVLAVREHARRVGRAVGDDELRALASTHVHAA